MYCIFAKESVAKMNGNRGKLAAQAGHAYLHAFWKSQVEFPKMAQLYYETDHAYKISLTVDTVEELKDLEKRYSSICGTSLVKDAGFTVFKEPTITCLGIGPIPEDLIGDDLKTIKVFS